ncbi:MAG TPA: RHS repeat-associated core domain-containing protein, partial [Terracidiphilus sp.]|nr:RHS repeat-associated core domain-containing protein [Terracidiphilus sp.]
MQQVIDGTTTMFQYLYDAEGNRVAKGTITSFSCDNSINQSTGRPNNGFLATAAFVLGPRGEQMTEMTNNSGTWQWAHTNVDAAGLSATYDADPTGQTEGPVYFHLFDWLGTRRQQTDYAGNPVINFTSLPFGDGLAPIAVSTTDVADSTEHHFTGKERDAESGNDYFGARYYASSMGRFMSPDWSAKEEPVPYAKLADPQSLNLYVYVLNNPLNHVDLDGHTCKAGDWGCNAWNAAAQNWNQVHQIVSTAANKVLSYGYAKGGNGQGIGVND